LSHSTSPFLWWIFFEIGSLGTLCLGCDPPDLCLLSSWDYRCEPLLPGLLRLFWSWVSRTTCLHWPWTMILLVSVSQVARITGVSHRHLAYCQSSWCREPYHPRHWLT
jgi:hypothetical protein